MEDALLSAFRAADAISSGFVESFAHARGVLMGAPLWLTSSEANSLMAVAKAAGDGAIGYHGICSVAFYILQYHAEEVAVAASATRTAMAERAALSPQL